MKFIDNKDTQRTSMTSFWCVYCQLELSHCSRFSIADFHQVNADWDSNLLDHDLHPF